MTKEDILKEVIPHDNDNLDEVKEEEDLEIVDEFFQCPTGSLFMSTWTRFLYLECLMMHL